MSNGPTLRERIASLEAAIGEQSRLLSNHIHHHEVRDQWFLRILGCLVGGVVLMALPGCIRLLAGVL